MSGFLCCSKNDPASSFKSFKKSSCGCLDGVLGRRKDKSVSNAVRLRLSSGVPKTPKSDGSELDFRHLLLAPDPSREIAKSYKNFQQVGVGGFGSVWKAQSLNTNEWFAVKQVPKTKVAEDMEFVSAELEAMIKLDHPNVVKFNEYFEDSRLLYIVTELCVGGDFSDLNHGIDEPKEIKQLFKDAVRAVSYCHDLGVAHRDLKFENCLINKVPGQRRVGKVIDFGLSAIQRPGDKGQWLNEQLGTRYFVAPEVVDSRIDYGVKCDCWSLGVMLYIILTDEHPIASDANRLDTIQLFRRILAKPVREDPLEDAEVETTARDLIMKLLRKDPEARLSAKEALNHPWMLEKGKKGHSWASATMRKSSNTSEKSGDSPLKGSVLERMSGFGNYSRFEKALLTIVAHQSHCHEVEDLREAFSELDINNTGSLTLDEIRAGLVKSGKLVKEDDLTQLFESLDLDGTGKISYTEWLAATMKPAMLQTDRAMRQVFDFLDIDRTGKVNRCDLVQVLGNDAEALRAIKEADLTGDGCLSFDEFQVMMKKLSTRMEGVAAKGVEVDFIAAKN
eukprot:TRINITY_DN14722_c0_g3_i1.p1 TRINITY_DN14722_c0_g3~~TRINITY_DN14722_c0_g3_i1.p1  ORF type:complete len:562 (+),score=135.29 TRINITY_DN14722_c0_g3_i1:44-1729(+)